MVNQGYAQKRAVIGLKTSIACLKAVNSTSLKVQLLAQHICACIVTLTVPHFYHCKQERQIFLPALMLANRPSPAILQEDLLKPLGLRQVLKRWLGIQFGH